MPLGDRNLKVGAVLLAVAVGVAFHEAVRGRDERDERDECNEDELGSEHDGGVVDGFGVT